MTFWLVAQCLNQLHYDMLQNIMEELKILADSLK